MVLKPTAEGFPHSLEFNTTYCSWDQLRKVSWDVCEKPKLNEHENMMYGPMENHKDLCFDQIDSKASDQ